jgi:hypothetical protein
MPDPELNILSDLIITPQQLSKEDAITITQGLHLELLHQPFSVMGFL